MIWVLLVIGYADGISFKSETGFEQKIDKLRNVWKQLVNSQSLFLIQLRIFLRKLKWLNSGIHCWIINRGEQLNVLMYKYKESINLRQILNERKAGEEGNEAAMV